MTVNRFYIVTRQPSRNDPGNIETGWYTFANGLLTLTDERGEPLPGGHHTELSGRELPSIIAKQLLRQQRDVNSRARSFNQPINYPPLKGIV
jgi:hypothetical protein